MSDSDPKYCAILDRGYKIDLPVRQTPGGAIAYFNLEDDYRLASKTGKWLARLIWPEPDFANGPEILAMPAGKAICLLHAIANYAELRETEVDLVVAKKEVRAVMREPIVSYSYRSVTTDRTQTLYLDADSVKKVQGKRVAIIDDVVSSGGSVAAMQSLIEQAGGTVTGIYAVFTEGGSKLGVTALGNLPFPCPLPNPLVRESV